jgi:hypothetical protein
MRAEDAALFGVLSAVDARARMELRIRGEIFEFGERGDTVSTPGKSLALEAQPSVPTAIKERSPM